MSREIGSQLERARELYHELRQECERRVGENSVHLRIRNLAVEVAVKLRGALDHAAHVVYEATIEPNLSPDESRNAKVYFPVADNENAFRSTMGRGKMLSLEKDSPETFAVFWRAQPFVSADNRWLAILGHVVNKGKHVRLMQQVRQVKQRTTVQRGNSSVSWTRGNVKFGSDVSVVGAPIDPRTQDVAPTAGVTFRTVDLVSYEFPDYDVNVLAFLKDALAGVDILTKELLSAVWGRPPNGSWHQPKGNVQGTA